MMLDSGAWMIMMFIDLKHEENLVWVSDGIGLGICAGMRILRVPGLVCFPGQQL